MTVSAVHRRIGRLLTGAGLGALPWTAHLVWRADLEWRWFWVGLDAAQAAGLLVTGRRLATGRECRTVAMGTAGLLAVDAVVDLWTAKPGADWWRAVVMGAAVEVPLAASCLVAGRTGRAD